MVLHGNIVLSLVSSKMRLSNHSDDITEISGCYDKLVQ